VLELRQTQSLKLVQSPQQILLSSLLQLQIQALELRIHNELEMNPVLELDEITDPTLDVEQESYFLRNSVYPNQKLIFPTGKIFYIN